MSASTTASTTAFASAARQLPPEIANLGAPDEVFDLASSKHSSQTKVLIVVCLVFMVICFGIAFPMLAAGIKPFGANPPPPAIAFGFGGLCLVLGMGLAYGAYYFAYKSRAGAEAYYLFPETLAVHSPAGTRLIEWRRIGPEKPASSFNPQHVFPVDGDADIRFDHAAAEHDALEMAITHRSTKARWTLLLTAEVAAALSDSQSGPWFLAHDPADRGLYRVSILGGRLLFARLCDGCATGTRGFAPLAAPAFQGGLTGAYVAWSQAQQIEKTQALIDRFDGVDDRQLFDMAAALPGGRILSVDEISSPHVSPPTTWEKWGTAVHIAAVLRFRQAGAGDKKLYLESSQQVDQATEVLREACHVDLRAEALAVS
jgi:hypothetical protein